MSQPAKNRAYIEDFFQVIDTMDAERFSQHFRTDGLFIFANQPAAQGRAAIAAVAQGVFDLLRGIGHELVRFAEDEHGVLMIEGRVTYRPKHREAPVILPFACSLQRDPEGLISEYRSFVDVAPLFQ